MAKAKKKDTVTLSKDAFMGLLLFVIAVTVFAIYFYLTNAGR